MPDISERFGQLRSMLSSFKPREELSHHDYRRQIQALLTLLREAKQLDPDRYATEWLAYLHAFDALIFCSTNSLQGLNEWCELLPPSIPIHLNIEGDKDASRTGQHIKGLCDSPHITRLTHLTLSSINRGQDALSNLFTLDLPSLKTLSIRGCCFQKKTMHAAVAASFFEQIESLQLVGTTYRIKRSLLDLLLEANRLSRLEVLTFSGDEVHPVDFEVLCERELPQHLTTISMTSCKLADGHAHRLAASTTLDPARHQLQLSRNRIRPSGLIALMDAGFLPAEGLLQGSGQLWSEGEPLQGGEAKLLAQSPHLEKNTKAYCEVRHYQEPSLLGLVLKSEFLQGLESLVLDFEDVRSHRYIELFEPISAQRGILKSLKSLTITLADELSASHLQCILQSDWAARLTQLVITNSKLSGSGEGFASCFEDARFPALQSLALVKCDLKDAMLGAILKRVHGSLTSLNLRRNKIALKEVDFGASLPALKHLDLSDNAIQAAGVSSLVAASWPQLETLALDRNRLGDQGVMTLMGAPCVAGLQSLNLHHNDTSMDAVYAVLESPHLQDPSRVSIERLDKVLADREKESVGKVLFELDATREARRNASQSLTSKDIVGFLPRLHHLWTTERAAFESRLTPWLDEHCVRRVSVDSLATFKMAADLLPVDVEIVLAVIGHGQKGDNKPVVGIFSELSELKDHPRFTSLFMRDLDGVQGEMKEFFKTQSFQYLREVTIFWCDVGRVWAAALRKAPLLATIESFELTTSADRDRIYEVLAKTPMPRLKRLALQCSEPGLRTLLDAPWIGQLELLSLTGPVTQCLEPLTELLNTSFHGKIDIYWGFLKCESVSQLLTLIDRSTQSSVDQKLQEKPQELWQKVFYGAYRREDAIQLVNHPILATHTHFYICDILTTPSTPFVTDGWDEAQRMEVREELGPFVAGLFRSEVFRPKTLELEYIHWELVEIFLEPLLDSPVLAHLERIEMNRELIAFHSMESGPVLSYQKIIDWMLSHQDALAHLKIRSRGLVRTPYTSTTPQSLLRLDQLERMQANPDLFISHSQIALAMQCFETS